MEKKTTSITLSAPAKIGGKFRKVGEQVHVTDAELVDLIQANAINGESVKSIVVSSEGGVDLDLAVATKAQALAETMVEEAVRVVVEPLKREHDELKEKFLTETANVTTLTNRLTDETARADTAEKALSETKLTEEQIAEIREEARKASVENIGSIATWLKVEENAKAVLKLNDAKAAKAVSDALGREITEPEYKTAVTALELSK